MNVDHARSALARVAEDAAPSAVLALGEDAVAAAMTWHRAHPDAPAPTCVAWSDTATTLAALDRAGRHALALVTVTDQAPELVRHALARLRDLHAERLWVCVDHDRARLGPTDLVALALVAVDADAPDPDPQPRFSIHQYDVSTYKRTPDWLSPRNWANPERWNRHRW
ncbi:MAG: hypothetical protein H6983_25395 [Ectothiorhodospiraceae bacterium]|nr:hypothetical protein [Ectothiorhodospiraceae bacterium]